MQFQTYIPLRIANVLIADEISVQAFVSMDVNNSAWLEEFWVENLDGTAPLKIAFNSAALAEKLIWNELHSLVWAAIEDDVKDALLEAA